MPETVTRYLLDHYVTVCERFNFATAESDYEECGAFHSAAAQSGLVCRMGSLESVIPFESLQGRHLDTRPGRRR